MAAVVVRHKLFAADLQPVQGRAVTARLIAPAVLLADSTGSIITATQATSGVDGLVELSLTPQTQIATPGTYYEVVVGQTTLTYYCVVPDSGPVQLVDCLVDPATLDPVDSALPSVFIARTELGVANGAASLDGAGKVPVAQLPAGVGGISSVNGDTGPAVTLDAADVGALTQAAGDVRYSQLGHTHATSDIVGFTAAVDARVQNIVGAAPAALDTLVELAAALDDDADFAGTLTTAIATKQPLDADLTAIAALAPSDNDLLQRIAGVWAARTPAQVKTSLALVKADVGLSNVDNTADTAKPVSTAQATAINNRGVQAVASSGLQNVSFTGDTSGAWTLCPAAYRVTIAAAAGDVLSWEPHLLVNAGADAELDVASVVTGAAARYFSSGTAVQAGNGHGGLYIGVGYNRALKPIRWIVTADDLDGGNVTLALMHRSGSGVTFGHAVYPGQVDVTNLGAAA